MQKVHVSYSFVRHSHTARGWWTHSPQKVTQWLFITSLILWIILMKLWMNLVQHISLVPAVLWNTSFTTQTCTTLHASARNMYAHRRCAQPDLKPSCPYSESIAWQMIFTCAEREWRFTIIFWHWHYVTSNDTSEDFVPAAHDEDAQIHRTLSVLAPGRLDRQMASFLTKLKPRVDSHVKYCSLLGTLQWRTHLYWSRKRPPAAPDDSRTGTRWTPLWFCMLWEIELVNVPLSVFLVQTTRISANLHRV